MKTEICWKSHSEHKYKCKNKGPFRGYPAQIFQTKHLPEAPNLKCFSRKWTLQTATEIYLQSIFRLSRRRNKNMLGYAVLSQRKEQKQSTTWNIQTFSKLSNNIQKYDFNSSVISHHISLYWFIKPFYLGTYTTFNVSSL